jgi:hypothetical protein
MLADHMGTNLEITDAQVLKAKELGYSPYARILGFKKEAGSLLSLLRD